MQSFPFETMAEILRALGPLAVLYLGVRIGRSYMRFVVEGRASKRPKATKRADTLRRKAVAEAMAELDEIDRAHGVHPEQTGDIAPEDAWHTTPDGRRYRLRPDATGKVLKVWEHPPPPPGAPRPYAFDTTAELHARYERVDEKRRALAERMKQPGADPRLHRDLRVLTEEIRRLQAAIEERIRYEEREIEKLDEKMGVLAKSLRAGGGTPLIISGPGYSETPRPRDRCPECASVERHARGVGARLPRGGCDDEWHEGGPVPVVADPELIATQWNGRRRKPPPDPKFPGTR